ncbi:MAG: hypothetical protein ACYCWE_13710 [Eubacteriales bacterium]
MSIVKKILMILLSFLSARQKLMLSRVVHKFLSGKKNVSSNVPYDIISVKGADCFVGYYDINPIQSGKLLYHMKNDKSSICDLMLYDLETKEKRKIGETYAWNWQMGARMRWLPASEEIITWNSYDNQYGAILYNIKTAKIKKLSFPLYDISSNGHYGATLDFQLLGSLRPGYGYSCQRDFQCDVYSIRLINIEKNECERCLTMARICNELKFDKVERCYINHICFNPDSNKFIFFFINILNNKHNANLALYDIERDEIKLLDGELCASHYCWVDSENVITTSYDAKNNCRYYNYDVNIGIKKELCPKCLKEDGHPTVLCNGKKIITDTYPDKNGFQYVFLVDVEYQKKTLLFGAYSSAKRIGEQRCDLHPHVDVISGKIILDASVKKNRNVYILEG